MLLPFAVLLGNFMAQPPRRGGLSPSARSGFGGAPAGMDFGSVVWTHGEEIGRVMAVRSAQYPGEVYVSYMILRPNAAHRYVARGWGWAPPTCFRRERGGILRLRLGPGTPGLRRKGEAGSVNVWWDQSEPGPGITGEAISCRAGGVVLRRPVSPVRSAILERNPAFADMADQGNPP
jgi:hypothetical protein